MRVCLPGMTGEVSYSTGLTLICWPFLNLSIYDQQDIIFLCQPFFPFLNANPHSTHLHVCGEMRCKRNTETEYLQTPFFQDYLKAEGSENNLLLKLATLCSATYVAQHG